jgi:hypothetical protein
MGFTPAQTWAMNLWEWTSAFEGWRRANSPPDDATPFPTREEHLAAVERVTLH